MNSINNKNNNNNNNSKVKDQDFIQLMNQSSIFEKVILQDLDHLFDQDQTDHIYDLFFKNESFKEPLFHLAKAYANFDDHVGYSKEFIYIALPLLIHVGIYIKKDVYIFICLSNIHFFFFFFHMDNLKIYLDA